MSLKETEITYKKLLGTNSLDDPTSLNMDPNQGLWCESCVNTDIDKYGKPHRRDGFNNVGDPIHSLWCTKDGKYILGINNRNLVRVIDLVSYNYQILVRDVGNNDMVFEEDGDAIYYTNNIIFGKLIHGANTSLSTSVEYKRIMPAGHLMKKYRSRLFVAKGNLIIYSDPIYMDRYDERSDKSFLRLATRVTLLDGVSNGLYISDEDNTYFFGGAPYNKEAGTRFIVKYISNYGAIKGTSRYVRDIRIMGKNYSEALFWTSKEGMCIGLPDGEFINVTGDRVNTPNSRKGAGIFIPGSINKYISNLQP